MHSSGVKLRYLLAVLGTVGAVALVPRMMTASSILAPLAQRTNQTISAEGLAAHLKKINAKMYGAYWCPACRKQKQLFGNAFEAINYIECDARGTNPKPELCKQAKVRVYPTWEINGKQYEGVLSLNTLAQLSGYQGQ